MSSLEKISHQRLHINDQEKKVDERTQHDKPWFAPANHNLNDQKIIVEGKNNNHSRTNADWAQMAADWPYSMPSKQTK